MCETKVSPQSCTCQCLNAINRGSSFQPHDTKTSRWVQRLLFIYYNGGEGRSPMNVLERSWTPPLNPTKTAQKVLFVSFRAMKREIAEQNRHWRSNRTADLLFRSQTAFNCPWNYWRTRIFLAAWTTNCFEKLCCCFTIAEGHNFHASSEGVQYLTWGNYASWRQLVPSINGRGPCTKQGALQVEMKLQDSSRKRHAVQYT